MLRKREWPKMDDTPIRFTAKDVISLGTIVALIGIQWGLNSSRIAGAEERMTKIEASDKDQQKDGGDIKVKLTSIEKDVQQLRKDADENKQLLNKMLDELRNTKK